jgi:hypothetical protein
MKHPLFSLFALSGVLLSCTPKIAPERVAAWRPEKPLPGSELTLYYNPSAPQALLKNSPGVTAEVLELRGDPAPVKTRIRMHKKGKIWQGRLALQPDSRMLLIRFAAEETDDNQGAYWESLVFSADGRPVSGAHLQKAMLLQKGLISGFAYRTDLREAVTELEAELTIYPLNLAAKTALWDLLLRQYPVESTKERVRNELRQIYENAGGDEETLAALLPFFFRTGQAYAANQIIEESVALLPRGPVAAAARRWQIEQENDPQKKASMIEAYHRDFARQVLQQP